MIALIIVMLENFESKVKSNEIKRPRPMIAPIAMAILKSFRLYCTEFGASRKSAFNLEK